MRQRTPLPSPTDTTAASASTYTIPLHMSTDTTLVSTFIFIFMLTTSASTLNPSAGLRTLHVCTQRVRTHNPSVCSTPPQSGVQGKCHDCDRTYPYLPYPDLSTPIPSHLNHSRAPNTKPEPSDPLVSQQRTPEHSNSLASSQRIPDPTHLQPFLSLTSSRFPTPTLIPNLTHLRPLLFLASSRFPTTTLIPDPTPFDLHSFALSLFPTFHRSRDCSRAKPDRVPLSLDAS